MPKLTRYLQKIFANNSNQVGVFGTGTDKETSKNVETLQSADYEEGWSSAVITDKNYPIWQERDGVDYGLSYQLKYLFQNGIPEWLSTETYYTNSYCRYGSDIYCSLQDNNINQNPALNNGYWALISSANKDLSNLTTDGNNRLHALKSYLDDGTLLTDSDGLADVTNYAHSTFDSSKFTVVGSPTITSDGIASGFSTSNYLSNNIILGGGDWEVIVAYTTALNNLSSGIIFYTSACGIFYYNNDIYINIKDANSGNILNGHFTPNANTNYLFRVSYKNGTYNSEYSIDNGIAYTSLGANTTSSIARNATTQQVFYIGGNDSSACNGSIDLKQFSITVDGVEVFSGNKTGIDTIKPDDYTEIGTPTISADGVASGFSMSNYLTGSSIDLTNAQSLRIEGKFTVNGIPDNGGRWGCVFSLSNLSIGNDLPLRIVTKDRTSDSVTLIYPTSSTTWTLGTWKSITWGVENSFIIKASSTTMIFTLNGEEVINVSVDSAWWKQARQLSIGNSLDDSHYQLLNGSIDLNAFKIYVDGDLVYQPCLKIPYTESKTGSKIVDSIYRDRVNDMASQFGFANYYTLDEDNGNFTLPQTELYGLIENCLDVNMATQTEKNTIIEWCMPDYDNTISFNPTSGDAVDFNGWLAVFGSVSSLGLTAKIAINGIIFCSNYRGTQDGGGQNLAGITMVKSTDVITIENFTGTIYKIPFIGGNL